MFEVNCNITYKYLRVYTMSADVDFQVQNEFCIKALYIKKTFSLKWFPFKESHWYSTYYTHYPRFRIKKNIRSEKDKRNFKT